MFLFDRLADAIRGIFVPKQLPNTTDDQGTTKTCSIFDWDQDSLRQMLQSYLAGDFDRAEDFYESLRRDGRTYDGMRKRGQALTRFKQCWKVRKVAPAEVKLATKRLRKLYSTECLTKTDLAETGRRLASFGVCLVHRHYRFTGGIAAPAFKPWPMSGVSYDAESRRFRVPMKDGTIHEVPLEGDDKFLVVTTGGERPWIEGAIVPMAKLFLLIWDGWDKWALHNDKQALALRVLKTPFFSREQIEQKEAYRVVKALRCGDTWLNPQGQGNTPGYELGLIESRHANAYEAFKELLALAWSCVAIIWLGHNLSQEVKGGSLAATAEATDVTRDVSVADAEMVESAFRPVFTEWLRAMFRPEARLRWPAPVEQLAPSWGFETAAPVDRSAEAEIAGKNATATKTTIEAMNAAHVDIPTVGIDWRAQAKACGMLLLPKADKLPPVTYGEPPAELPPTHAQQLNAGKRPRLLMSAREPESEEDRRALIAAQAVVDGVRATDREWEGQLAQDPTMGVSDFGREALVRKVAEALTIAAALGLWSAVVAYAPDVPPALRVRLLREMRAIGARRLRWRTIYRAAAQAIRDADPALALDHATLLTLQSAQDRAPLVAAQIRLDKQARARAAAAAGQSSRQALAESPVLDLAKQRELAHARIAVMDQASYRAAFPFWRYVAFLDANTTEGCRKLNGLTMPAGTAQWAGFVPPRHFHCRAHLEAIDAKAAARASKTTPELAQSGAGTFATLLDDWNPAPQNYPADLWAEYQHARGIPGPHLELDGPWWRNDYEVQ